MRRRAVTKRAADRLRILANVVVAVWHTETLYVAHFSSQALGGGPRPSVTIRHGFMGRATRAGRVSQCLPQIVERPDVVLAAERAIAARIVEFASEGRTGPELAVEKRQRAREDDRVAERDR